MRFFWNWGGAVDNAPAFRDGVTNAVFWEFFGGDMDNVIEF